MPSSSSSQSTPLLSQPAYLASAEEAARALDTHRETGLSAAKVAARQETHGPNSIPDAGRRPLLFLFLDRFRDFLVLFLAGAAIISILLGEITDAIIIGIAIFLDATLSFVQVWRTEHALAQLKAQVEQMTTVIRDGTAQQVPARTLVVGDIIEFRAGEHITADARLLSVQGLKVHEAALTGEAAHISKQTSRLEGRTPLGNRTNMVFMGTSVVSGSGRAVVTAIGTRTEFGKIAQVLKTSKSPRSPLHKKLQRVAVRMSVVIVGLVVVLSGLELWQGETLESTIRTAITLVVSVIPEDLTIILTIALTVGVSRILKQRGVVRELASGETLGAATVICTDKTGTLTQGQMSAEFFDCLQGDRISREQAPREPLHTLALTGFALASTAHRVSPDKAEYVGSATERVAVAFVEDVGLVQQQLQSEWQQRDAIQFSSQWKYRATLHDHPTQATQALFVSGAPDVLLERSSQVLNEHGEPTDLSGTRRAEITRTLEARASEGARLLAIAVKRHLRQTSLTHDDVQGLLLLGVLVIRDPVRPQVREVIQQTQSAGVAIKLVTGDLQATAQAVAREVGLTATAEYVYTGDMLADMSDEELRAVIEDAVIFARVTPLDKQRIVRALQENGHVVAMTGDGVNDAVALKAADIGVAMGTGTDIAKDAADLILLDSSFATIVAAIREGRVIRDNVRKVLAFLLSTNAAEVAIFLVSLLFRLPLPLLPAQILWINLVTDGTSDVALALEPEERNVMQRPPEPPTIALITRQLIYHILFVGGAMTAACMGLYWYLYETNHSDLTYVRTMIFSLLSVASLLSTWSYSSLWETIRSRGIAHNKWLFVSAAFSLCLHMAAVYLPGFQRFFDTVPLSAADWALIGGLAIGVVAVAELRKVFFRYTIDRDGVAPGYSTPAPAKARTA